MLHGRRIRERRQTLNLSQEELAARIKTSQKRISMYERGESDANGDTIAALARALETSADYLLGLTDIPNPYMQTDRTDDQQQQLISAIENHDFRTAMQILGEIARS